MPRRSPPFRPGHATVIVATALWLAPFLFGGAAGGEAGGSAGDDWIPGRVIVSLATDGPHAVTGRAHQLLAERRSFASASRDGSDSLDLLMARYAVRRARAHFVARGARDAASATRAFRDLVRRQRARFPARALRAAGRAGISGAASEPPDPTSVYLLEMDEAVDPRVACEEFLRDPHVEACSPDFALYPDQFVPNDPDLARTWALENDGRSGGVAGADVDATAAWGFQRGSADVVVAVVDSGIDFLHPDLAPNLWRNPGEAPGDANGDGFPGVAGVDDDGDGLVDEDGGGREPGDAFYANDLRDDDDENGFPDDVIGWDVPENDPFPQDRTGHGTSVAGIVGGVGHNATGTAGINHRVSIMAVSFLGTAGTGGSTFDAIEAVDYAVMNGADVINASYGRQSAFGNALEQQALERAGALGVLFVAAAGNDGGDNDEIPHFPASYELDNVLSVAASDRRDERAIYSGSQSSNVGRDSVDLAAPGDENWTTARGGGYRDFAGTSAAAPHAAGAAALALAQDPALTTQGVKSLLMNTVDPLPAFQGLTVTGGRLNVGSAVQRVAFFQRLARVRGTVTDAGSGAPLEGARISVPATGHEVRAGPDGTFEITVPEGETRLLFRALGFEPATADLVLAVATETVVDRSLAQAGTVELRGRVRELDGGAPASGTLRFHREGERVAEAFASTASGYAVDLVPGRYDVDVVPSSPDLTGRLYFDVLVSEDDPMRDFEVVRDLFQRVSGSGISYETRPRAAAFGDYDADGDDDLLLTFDGRPDRLYRNEGGQAFARAIVGVESDARTFSPRWADYDRDGDLDLFSPTFGQTTRPGEGAPDEFYRNDGGVYQDVASLLGLTNEQSVAFASWADPDGDALLDLLVIYHQEPSRLFGQRPDGTFEERPLPPDIAAMSGAQRPAWSDFDGDGDADVAVNGVVFRNDGGTLVPAQTLLDTERAEEHPAWGDYDGDGDLDLVFPGDRKPPRLFRNDGGLLTDATAQAGLTGGGANHTRAHWADWDDDGDLDLFLTTHLSSSLAGPVGFYRNEGGGSFRDVRESSGLPSVGARDFAAWSDYDGDGDLDLWLGDGLYRNRGNANHWLELRLESTRSNGEAIGARVTLEAGGRLQTREVHGDTGDSRVVHFGLGDRAAADRVVVRWPAGARSVLEDVVADQMLVLVEPLDLDGDGVADDVDNCPVAPNPDQADTGGFDSDGAGDGTGDACQCGDADADGDVDADDALALASCIAGAAVCDPALADTDDDGALDGEDLARLEDALLGLLDPSGIACLRASDVDLDGIGSAVDNCPADRNPAQEDEDADGVGDRCDACPGDPTNDPDADAVCNAGDNCPGVPNPDQGDADADGDGDACDADADDDGVPNEIDACPLEYDPSQSDADGDGLGDACERCPFDAGNDPDGDGHCALADNCPDVRNPPQRDVDGDGTGDVCDPDADDDGVANGADLCPGSPGNSPEACAGFSLLGVLEVEYPIESIDVAWPYAYIGARSLDVIDVSDPSRPVPVGSWPIPDSPPNFGTDVLAAGDTVYVQAGETLYALDVSDPTAPTVRTQAALAGSHLERRGDRLLVLSSQRITSAVDRGESIEVLVAVPALGTLAGARLVGHRLLVSTDTTAGALQIFDVSEPEEIVELDRLPGTFLGDVDVDEEWQRALLPSFADTAYVDVAPGDDLRIVHTVDLSTRRVRELEWVGNRAYLPEQNTGGQGIRVWDVTLPEETRQIGNPLDAFPYGTVFTEDRFYVGVVVQRTRTLQIWGVTDLDGDGVSADAPDNCPFYANAAQSDADGDGIGDACQCGDVTGDGLASIEDVARILRHARGLAPDLPFPGKCNVAGIPGGSDEDCDAEDARALRERLLGSPDAAAQLCARGRP